MKFISIDIETTGLDPQKNQILEFGAIAIDTSKHEPYIDSFRAVFIHQELTGNPIALTMNAGLINEINTVLKDKDTLYILQSSASDTVYVRNSQGFQEYFDEWLQSINFTERLTLAGKNLASFDLKFIEAAGIKIKYRHRMIDPAILYVDWEKDETLPDLQQCLDRAGIVKSVEHTSLGDAGDVAELVLKKLLCS
ncbi:exonuclease domain-containing protein [Sulfuricurvum sp.]|uniref:exonuclease domain-containing protein n=1 Tax=Sulfuricurvum sp. TaxID=2025608 RepID=UPI003BB11565